VEITSPLTGGPVIGELLICNSDQRNTGGTVTLLTDGNRPSHIEAHLQIRPLVREIASSVEELFKSVFQYGSAKMRGQAAQPSG